MRTMRLTHLMSKERLPMTTVPQVARALETTLRTTANAAAVSSGFIQRQRQLTGASFVQGLVFGWLAHPAATYEQLAQAVARAGTPISPQGLEQRFTPAATQLLQDVLAAATETVIRADGLAASLLQRFAGVWVLDTTIIPLPAVFARLWPGSGKSEAQGRAAAIKLHACLDLLSGALRGPLLGPGRPHDKCSPLQRELPPPGTLRLTDLGFYALAVLRSLGEAGAFWLCRAQVQTTVCTSDGQRWTLVELLRAQRTDVVDLPVWLGASERLPARLIAFRLDGQAAARRRRKVRYVARRKAHPASPERLALCSWDVLVTNVPTALLTAEEARILGRARWQIELLFKLWKSEGQLEESRSLKPYRILGELYAKLIGLVIQHWCTVLGCWPCLERSLTKAGRVVREYALDLARDVRWPRRLRETLRELVHRLQHRCRVNTRKSHPNHCQLIQISVHAA
jgi:DDE family transposase